MGEIITQMEGRLTTFRQSDKISCQVRHVFKPADNAVPTQNALGRQLACMPLDLVAGRVLRARCFLSSFFTQHRRLVT